jgi:cytidylate kinase
MSKNIAIDGPAGAGKSTIARRLAEKLGLVYVDTGAMYRTLALFCLRKGVDLKSEEVVVAAVGEAEVKLSYENGVQQIFLNGENVSEAIRCPEVSAAASNVSVYGPVRSRLVQMQQELAKETDVVMDGRDIGTVVLPDAFLKIFLTASPAERARRRAEELRAKGQTCDVKEIEAEIRSRDERDMNREISPLKQAEDAVLVDTTRMDIEEVAACIRDLYEKKNEAGE